jgi:hypothetical protein
MIVFTEDELFPVREVSDASVASYTDSSGDSITMLDVFCRIWREAVEIRPLVDGKFVFTDDMLDGDAVEPYMSDEEFRLDAKQCIQVYKLVRGARAREHVYQEQCNGKDAVQITYDSPRITVICRLGVCRISDISSMGTEEAEVFSVEKVRGLMETAFAKFDAATAEFDTAVVV